MSLKYVSCPPCPQPQCWASRLDQLRNPEPGPAPSTCPLSYKLLTIVPCPQTPGGPSSCSAPAWPGCAVAPAASPPSLLPPGNSASPPFLSSSWSQMCGLFSSALCLSHGTPVFQKDFLLVLPCFLLLSGSRQVPPGPMRSPPSRPPVTVSLCCPHEPRSLRAPSACRLRLGAGMGAHDQ